MIPNPLNHTVSSQISKRSQINTSWQTIKSKINEKGENSKITSYVCTECKHYKSNGMCIFINKRNKYIRSIYDEIFHDSSKFSLINQPVLRFWSVGSSLSTDLRLTNQILYRIILLSTFECFCIQRNHCSEKYSPQNAAYGDHRQEVYVPDTTMRAC